MDEWTRLKKSLLWRKVDTTLKLWQEYHQDKWFNKLEQRKHFFFFNFCMVLKVEEYSIAVEIVFLTWNRAVLILAFKDQSGFEV